MGLAQGMKVSALMLQTEHAQLPPAHLGEHHGEKVMLLVMGAGSLCCRLEPRRVGEGKCSIGLRVQSVAA